MAGPCAGPAGNRHNFRDTSTTETSCHRDPSSAALRPGGLHRRPASPAGIRPARPGPARPPPHARNTPARREHYGLTGAEPFWYVLGCIYFGAAYMMKLPARKAASEILSELQFDGGGPSRGYG